MQLLIKLGVRRFQMHMLIECTRCGGSHPLSRCPWPVWRPGAAQDKQRL